jgi:3-methyladenine DNA glycosylase/8-oxoguanine DNA glycosylase
MSMALAELAGTAGIERRLDLGFRVDAQLTLAALRHGPGDPTIRFEPGGVVWRASLTPAGPATIRLAPLASTWHVLAWGDGAEHALETLPRLLGADDDPSQLDLPWGRLRALAERFAGLRFGRSDDVMGSLLPAIVEQKVTGGEAQRSWRALVLRHGDVAPGPGRLRLAPRAQVLAALPAYDLHGLGLEQRRAATLIRAARRASFLEPCAVLPRPEAMARLRTIPGVGVWTAAETVRGAFGDPDALSLGDFHTPNLVAWALAGEARGTDARMLELLEPYRGQRARLVRLLELSGIRAPAYGPRRPLRSITAM